MLLKITFITTLLLTSSCGIQSIPSAFSDVEASWAEVQNQYKRRADLIPSLINVVKGFAKQEKDVLEGVINARSKATSINIDASKLTPENMKQFSQAQQGLSSALSRLMAVSERYPELRSSERFGDLQTQIEGTENRITVARTRYIEVINRFNKLITVPPTSWTNSMMLHYEKKPQFAVDNIEDAQNPPKIEF